MPPYLARCSTRSSPAKVSSQGAPCRCSVPRVTTVAQAGEAPSRALGAATMCEAFQLTAAERSDQVALRTIGGRMSITFGEYAERVRAIAGGLHALGVRRGDTVAFMLTNRPEFHLIDAAAMHL